MNTVQGAEFKHVHKTVMTRAPGAGEDPRVKERFYLQESEAKKSHQARLNAYYGVISPAEKLAQKRQEARALKGNVGLHKAKAVISSRDPVKVVRAPFSMSALSAIVSRMSQK